MWMTEHLLWLTTSGRNFFLLLYGSQRWNSGHQDWQQGPPLAEPSFWCSCVCNLVCFKLGSSMQLVNAEGGVGAMTPQSRTLATLPENLGLISNTCVVARSHL